MTVFANGLEISAKAQGCKVIAAFPDTCFTPPQTPATPPGVPLPYPNFGTDSDLTSGTDTVKIGGEMVSQENKSKYSKCSGDEAGAAPKKGIITSKNTGAVYAQKWSMDVKVQSKGVVRFSDLATTNHASTPGDDGPWQIIGTYDPMRNPDGKDCLVGEYDKKQPDCSKNRTPPPPAASPGPPPDPGGRKYQFHHIIPDRTFRYDRTVGDGLTPKGNVRYENHRQEFGPKQGKGICICLPPDAHSGSKKSAPGTAVHQELDDRLTALGQGRTPVGCAPLKEVRLRCLIALHKLVPHTISMACFKHAMKEVNEKTKDIEDKLVRTEKSLNDLPATSRTALENVK